jgi:hypothetical protein
LDLATIIAFVTGAIIPIVANLITAKSKFHYDNKLKQDDIFKKEIRSFFLAKPQLISAQLTLSNMINYNLYNYHNRLLENVERLQKIPLDEIPLPIFELYYECLGNLEYLATDGKDVNDETVHERLREALREVHVETEQTLEELIINYEYYMNNKT